jgi:hypothetical protein
MSVSVPHADVLRMLEHCANGFEIRRTTHGYIVKWNNNSFPDLPKHKDILIGHLRKMIRHLGIDKDCARSFGCY